MSSKGRKVISLALVTMAALLGCFACIWQFSVRATDPDLRDTGLELQYHKQAFSGIVFDFHRNHQPKKLLFVWQGQRRGLELSWYKNGVLASEYPYKEGRRHGTWKQWYDDGRVRSLRHYKEGRAHGEYWAWHSNGKVSDYRIYDEGQERLYKSFISDGRPFYNYTYQDGKRVGVKGGSFCKSKVKP